MTWIHVSGEICDTFAPIHAILSKLFFISGNYFRAPKFQKIICTTKCLNLLLTKPVLNNLFSREMSFLSIFSSESTGWILFKYYSDGVCQNPWRILIILFQGLTLSSYKDDSICRQRHETVISPWKSPTIREYSATVVQLKSKGDEYTMNHAKQCTVKWISDSLASDPICTGISFILRCWNPQCCFLILHVIS